MRSRTAPAILTTVAVATMVVSAIGFIVMVVGNTFFFDEYDEYGQVSIPGTGSVQLPAGDVKVTFHTMLVRGGGSSLPVPPLKYVITGPGGVDPQLTEDYGGTTIVNNDARVRIGYLHLPVAGSYDVRLDGNVSAYLDPTLAFGRDGEFAVVPWILAAVFGLALVDLIVARIWATRRRRRDIVHPGSPTHPSPPSYSSVPPYPSVPSSTWTPTLVPTEHSSPATFTPSEEGIRMQTLDTLARLRDSGALTQEEYDAEKTRVLDGR